MAYIIAVNPSILREAGMPPTAVAAATCVSAAVGSALMGAYARYPIALAPGMGINAYFTYTVVLGMGVAWQVALGAVFVSGADFPAADDHWRSASDRGCDSARPLLCRWSGNRAVSGADRTPRHRAGDGKPRDAGDAGRPIRSECTAGAVWAVDYLSLAGLASPLGHGDWDCLDDRSRRSRWVS